MPSPPGRAAPEDLALVSACLDGDRTALATLDRLLVAATEAVRRVDASPAFLDEVRQRLRDHLLVGDRPRLAAYAGRGPLGAWLRVAAMRIALNLRRGERARAKAERGASSPTLALLPPDLLLVVERARPEVEQALREAVARLDAADRLVLRLHFADGVTATRLGKMLGVDRTTAARRVRAAREAVLEHVRDAIASRLGLSAESVESLLRVVRSELHLSFSRWLAEE